MNRPTKIQGVAGTRGPEANGFAQLKPRINSAVSNTAGITVENEIVESTSNRSGPNNARPKYSQFPVRRLISSNNHHTGAEITNSSTKSLRDRVQSELPVRLQTKASTAKIYPSHSGKNR